MKYKAYLSRVNYGQLRLTMFNYEQLRLSMFNYEQLRFTIKSNQIKIYFTTYNYAELREKWLRLTRDEIRLTTVIYVELRMNHVQSTHSYGKLGSITVYYGELGSSTFKLR